MCYQKEVAAVLADVNKALSHSAHLVGKHVTLADIGVWAAIKRTLSLIRAQAAHQRRLQNGRD